MRVGMTYDLKDEYLAAGYSSEEVAELDSEATVEAIEKALRTQGHQVERVGNVGGLVQALASGRRWDLVFNIAEGMRGLGRESQIPALLDAWGIPYTFSGPELLALTLHKGWTNAVIRAHGLPTADFWIVSGQDVVEEIDLPFPLFVKPVAEGSSRGSAPDPWCATAGSCARSAPKSLKPTASPLSWKPIFRAVNSRWAFSAAAAERGSSGSWRFCAHPRGTRRPTPTKTSSSGRPGCITPW